jgi:AraC-like DNA-binding protein
LGVDAGSTDPGPYYLGSGKSFTDRGAVKRDLSLALPKALAQKAPFIIGTAGGAGSARHVQWLKDILLEIAAEFLTDEQTPYRVQMIRANLLRLMAMLCRRHGEESDAPLEDTRLLACMKQAIGHIHSNSHKDLSLEEVAKLVGLSKFYFSREFRRITGYTFLSYVNLIRCEKAKQLLTENQATVGEIGRLCGFENQSYFSRTFLKCTGMLPSAYRSTQKKPTK